MSAVLEQAAPSQSVPTGAPLPSQVKAAQDKAARNRSRQVRSSIPAGATSTPGALQPAENRQAVSTPSEINYGAVIRGINTIVNKNTLVSRTVSKKSKNSVFVMACNAIRSQLGLEARDKDGNFTPIPKEHEAKLRAAMNVEWDDQFKRFRDYGGPAEDTDLQITWDTQACKVVPMVDKAGKPVLNAAGKQMLDIDIRLRATARVSRAAQDLAEATLKCLQGEAAAEKRLATMLERPGVYTGDEVREQKDKVAAFNAKVLWLREQKQKMADRNLAIAALDARHAKGELSADAYKVEVAKIETAA